MVADPDGKPHEQLGLDKGFDRAVAQAVSGSGRELARGPFPEAAGSLGRAIEAAAPVASVAAGR